MSELTIITNHVPRDIVDAWELTPAERAEFDYLDWDAIEDGRDSASFFRYKGGTYDLGGIPAVDPVRDLSHGSPFAGWHGVLSDTFFSGILVRYCDDNETVVIGRYYS